MEWSGVASVAHLGEPYLPMLSVLWGMDRNRGEKNGHSCTSLAQNVRDRDGNCWQTGKIVLCYGLCSIHDSRWKLLFISSLSLDYLFALDRDDKTS